MKLDEKEIIRLANDTLIQNFLRYDIVMESAYDSVIVDTNGKEYIDFLSGIGEVSLGYSNEKFKAALKDQMDKLIHTSNYFYTKPQLTAANLLVKHSFADRVFFANSGAEANEGALKIARKCSHLNEKDLDKYEVVAMKNSFHGRTSMTLNVTDKPEFKSGKGIKSRGFVFVEFNNLKELKAAVNENTYAIIMEPLQGERGLHLATREFVELARDLADEFHAALIFDEIQCGMGRTGKLFAYEHYGIEPDILTLAKALGNGVPIGAILASGDFANVLEEGDHGTTFGGNPLSTRAATVVLEEMIEKNLPTLAADTGEYFKNELEKLKLEFDSIKDIRGKGLMLGIEVDFKCADIVRELHKRGFITNCTREYIIRFLPPLIITRDEIDKLILALKDVFNNI